LVTPSLEGLKWLSAGIWSNASAYTPQQGLQTTFPPWYFVRNMDTSNWIGVSVEVWFGVDDLAHTPNDQVIISIANGTKCPGELTLEILRNGMVML